MQGVETTKGFAMLVPDLDWPADLFEDARPTSESSIAISDLKEILLDTDMPLWPALQRQRTAEAALAS